MPSVLRPAHTHRVSGVSEADSDQRGGCVSLTFDPQVVDGVCEDRRDDNTSVLLPDTETHTQRDGGLLVLCGVLWPCVKDRLTTVD